jgi:hypothetical protein
MLIDGCIDSVLVAYVLSWRRVTRVTEEMWQTGLAGDKNNRPRIYGEVWETEVRAASESSLFKLLSP